MSETKNKINALLKESMKARDQATVTTLRGLTAAIKQFEVDTRTEADEEKVVSIVQKEIKMRRDAIGFAKEQGREDLLTQNEAEVALLQKFLGEQLSEDELMALIKEAITGGANNLGAIMGMLNKSHKGKFEGKIASELAKTLLS
jgi:uncharacterized protein YqeY